MAEPLPQLTIYSRRNCHLCDVMHDELQKIVAGRSLRIQIVDVDDSPELAKRHGSRVPVLFFGERELCHYHLDPGLLSEVLGPV